MSDTSEEDDGTEGETPAEAAADGAEDSLREAVISALGRSSPLLKSGLGSSRGASRRPGS